MINAIKNLFRKGYKSHPEAVLISCYYNPKNSPERLAAFNKFYPTIKHLNHRIIECIAPGVPEQLPNNPNIEKLRTTSTLWHKEQLLNRIVSQLPPHFRYVFWVDADVIFSNKNWMVEGVEALQSFNVVQCFEYCIHMEKGQMKPGYNVNDAKLAINNADAAGSPLTARRMWKGYASNYAQNNPNFHSQKYDIRGHVGFAWGAHKSILKLCPLYDRGLIGGGDGIIAYASTGQLETVSNVKEMFADVLQDVYSWGRKWQGVVRGKVGYIEGDLYHIWHGNVKDRQYYKRIKEFGPHLNQIARENERDENGLYTTRDVQAKQYVSRYYDKRDRFSVDTDSDDGDGFAESMAWGYITDDAALGTLIGGNPAGAIIGDMLNNSDDVARSTHSGNTRDDSVAPTESHRPMQPDQHYPTEPTHDFHPTTQPSHHPTTQPSDNTTDATYSHESVASSDTSENFS
jgi:hypothetical protein